MQKRIIFNPNSVTTMLQLAMAEATAIVLPNFNGGLRDSLSQLVTVGKEQK